MVPYLPDFSFQKTLNAKSFSGEGYEFLVDVDQSGFRLAMREGLYYLDKAYVKFFVILYLQLMTYGLLGLVFTQPNILQVLYYLTLGSPAVTYFYLFGYMRYQFNKHNSGPTYLTDQIFLHKDGKLEESKFARGMGVPVFEGCIGFFLLVSNDPKVKDRLIQNQLRYVSEFDYNVYMKTYDQQMNHFFLVMLTETGRIIPVGHPKINPITDGLIEAINYITDKIPKFRTRDMKKRVLKVEDSSFLIEGYFEMYSPYYNPMTSSKNINA